MVVVLIPVTFATPVVGFRSMLTVEADTIGKLIRSRPSTTELKAKRDAFFSTFNFSYTAVPRCLLVLKSNFRILAIQLDLQ